VCVVCGVHASTSYAVFSVLAVLVSDIHMSVQLELKVEGFLTGLLQLCFGIFVYSSVL
jgi:cyanate permease